LTVLDDIKAGFILGKISIYEVLGIYERFVYSLTKAIIKSDIRGQLPEKICVLMLPSHAEDDGYAALSEVYAAFETREEAEQFAFLHADKEFCGKDVYYDEIWL
jgi:hypothetical protein